MPALHEIQAAIGAALLGGEASGAAAHIAGDGLLPEARIAIHRHHVLTTLTRALEATFPVVCRLVDRRFFAYAADSYLRAHPPVSPCLFELGDTFPDFLAAFPPCRHLDYLPDVGRLEWAMNAALHAPDAEAMDAAALAEVARDDMARLVFAVDPSARFLASPWPVDRIWRANREGSDGADRVDLAAGPVWLEVRRAGDAVAMRGLAAADHALRAGLAGGDTLERAAAGALRIDPDLDLTAALRTMLEERIFTRFAVSN
jgi:hypothetical protein